MNKQYPALPSEWANGSFEGLVARGNFVVDCEWENMRVVKMKIHARRGGVCKVRYPGIHNARVTDKNGTPIEAMIFNEDLMIEMAENGVYFIANG